MSRASLMLVAAALCLVSTTVSVSTETPRFYPDDPIAHEPESQNANGAKPYAIQSMYEMTYNLFVAAGHKPSDTRARNVNTIDEVPDSSWFTNRVGPYQTGQPRVTTDAIARGPIAGAPPDPSRWVLIGEKTSGVHPGFRARDARGETWFIELDPKTNPEGATAAVTIATKFFWALGYNQVETFLTTFDPKLATIDPSANVKRPSGKKTAFTPDDLHAILETAARNSDGTYRIVAGRLIPGKILGNFLFAGTRADDPNDIVPHEHRRELRALRVFGAWTNLTDLKAGNTLDSLVTEDGRTAVKHYLQDVGSTFGMCNDVHEWDLSYEYFYDAAKTRHRFLSLGLALSPWQRIPYVEYPSIDKFEGDRFDPRAWRPQTPTTAYMEMRDDDAFWAARRVASFSEELIRAAVHTGQFSDPAAERYLGDVLIKRQRKIAKTYLTAVNPIVDPRLDANGRLTVDNAAVDSGVVNGGVANGGNGGATYRAVWMRFDNATGATSSIGETQSATTSIDAPRNPPATPGSYIQVDLSIDSDGYPTWRQPVRAWFRRGADGWTLAGFDRLPANEPPLSITRHDAATR